MISWGEELETQSRQLELDQPSTSTLAKRPASSRRKDAGEPATKRTKVEDGSDIRMFYEKGNLSKVRSLPIPSVALITNIWLFNSLRCPYLRISYCPKTSLPRGRRRTLSNESRDILIESKVMICITCCRLEVGGFSGIIQCA